MEERGDVEEEPSVGEATVGVGSPSNVYLLSYSFNQDHSCFVCGTTSGFRVFTTSPVCECHRREHAAVQFRNRSVSLVAMLFKTNIFAMVTSSHSDPNGGRSKIQIWDDQKWAFVCELRCRNEVKGVVLRRDVIAMVCEYAIYVYRCDKMSVILHLTTTTNARGLCVLAPASEPWILCCPGQSTGAVRVQVGQEDRATHVFTAHDSALQALAVNANGTLVATASEHGSVVKVWQTSDGQLFYRLRRGARPTTISCLTFRSDDRFLAVASSSPTVHVFQLDPDHGGELDGDRAASASPREEDMPPADASPDRRRSEDLRDGSLESIATRIQAAAAVASRAAAGVAAETVSGVVKGLMPRYLDDRWAVAKFRIPDVDASGQPVVDTRCKQANICGPLVAFDKTEARFFILHYSGVLYECGFDDLAPPGGSAQECSLLNATTWFAVRPDFKVQSPVGRMATVGGGVEDGDEEAEEWQLL